MPTSGSIYSGELFCPNSFLVRFMALFERKLHLHFLGLLKILQLFLLICVRVFCKVHPKDTAEIFDA